MASELRNYLRVYALHTKTNYWTGDQQLSLPPPPLHSVRTFQLQTHFIQMSQGKTHPWVIKLKVKRLSCPCPFL
jgi:hypothetical protein